MKSSLVLALVAIGLAAHGAEPSKPAPTSAPKVEASNPAKAPVAAQSQGTARLGTTKFAEAVPLNPGGEVNQRFKVNRSGIKGFSFPVVTYGKVPTAYKVEWTLMSLGKAGRVLARGTIEAARLTDWATINVPLASAPLPDENEFLLSFRVPKGAAVGAPMGLPLFHPESAGSKPLIVPGNATGPVLGLTVLF